MYNFTKVPLITERFLLPSNGKLYKEQGSSFDGNITLRAMTTMEERMRLGAQDFYESMVNIVNECIVDNKKPDGSYIIDSKYLTVADFDAICIKLRIITYGPNYRTFARCTSCGKPFKYVADLSDLEFNFLPDDFTEPYDIGPLPRSGDTLGCRFLRVSDRLEIDKEVQEILTKNPNYVGDPGYLLEMQKRIITVNGEPIDPIMCKMYVENMTGMDSDYYHRKIDNIKYGVTKGGIIDCNFKDDPINPCNGKAIFGVQSNEEFFRAGTDY